MVTFVVCLVICSLSFCQSEIIQKHYKSETSEASSSWQSMVYSARPDINTRIACAALCLSEDANCDGFVYQNQVCHLSQLGGNFNVVSGSTTAANVYIKEGASIPPPSTFMAIENVTQAFRWPRYIFTSIDNVPDEVTCENECKASTQQCDLFLMDGSQCHLGSKNMTTGTVVPSSAGPWKLFVSSAFVDTLDTAVGGEHEKVLIHMANPEWSRYVHTKVNSTLNITHCSAYCTFASLDQPCLFFAVDENSNCYLAALNTTTDGQTYNVSSIIIYGQPNVMNPSDIYPAMRKSGSFRLFIYHTYNITDIVTCGIMCKLHHHDCHFFAVANNDPSPCVIGNVVHGQGQGVVDERFTYFNEDGAASVNDSIVMDPHYHEVLPYAIPVRLWGSFTKKVHYNNGGHTLGSCSVFLHMTHEYDFFVLKNGYCFTGILRSHKWSSIVIDNEFQTVHFKSRRFMEIRALRDTHHEMIFDNKSASGSEWSHMVYTFFDTNITDIDRGQFRCFLSCYSDETPCDGFVYIHPLCYKTSWYINSTVANVATVATWFYRIPKAGIVIGGDNGTTIADAEVEILLDSHRLCPFSSSFFPSAPSPAIESTMTFIDPYLVLLGGVESGATSDKVFYLDLSSLTQLGWTAATPMPVKRRSFEVQPISNNELLIMGGKPDSGSGLPFSVLQTQTWSWSDLGITMPDDLFSACSVKHDQKIYILGGLNGSMPYPENATNTLYIYDLATSTLTLGPSMSHAKSRLGCGVVANAVLLTDPVQYLQAIGGNEISVNGPLLQRPEHLNLEENGSSWQGTTHALQLAFGDMGSGSGFMDLSSSKNDLEHYLVSSIQNGATLEAVWHYHNFDLYRWYSAATSKVFTKPRKKPSMSMIPSVMIPICHARWYDWVLVMRQTAGHAFTANQWSANPYDENADIFSVMDTIEEYRGCKGLFHFRLVWPELSRFNEWKQSSNPTNETTVMGYQALSVPYDTDFDGLKLDGGLGLMKSADDGPEQFFTLGRHFFFPPNLFPGPKTPTQSLFVNEQRLYVKLSCE